MIGYLIAEFAQLQTELVTTKNYPNAAIVSEEKASKDCITAPIKKSVHSVIRVHSTSNPHLLVTPAGKRIKFTMKTSWIAETAEMAKTGLGLIEIAKLVISQSIIKVKDNT